MAQALIVLEKHGILHRDIKGKNIFICIDGSFKLGM
jgi:serine/threonine protein kinase